MSSAATSDANEVASDRTLDAEEIKRFSRIAAEWWDPLGKFRPLHQIGPPRLSFIRDATITHFALDGAGLRPLKGLTVLDVGCGGGLVSEPLTRMGAKVTGIDPAERNIAIAKSHAEPQGLEIDYRAARIEDLVANGETFDIVACLEVVEHVPDVAAFISACAAALRPGGLAVFSTINRNFKSWALAIVGAEYVLGWLPIGTHQWNRFLTPDELAAHCAAAGLSGARFAGILYNPLKDVWSLSADTDVNYLVSVAKPGD
ncbi:MAG: bifunctional 2-polyprenyl-6-hydroxyphenol methylase/3-demethylubiquinol 3-O-methyltransferase UbiG [Hyphomicrobium sp.]